MGRVVITIGAQSRMHYRPFAAVQLSDLNLIFAPHVVNPDMQVFIGRKLQQLQLKAAGTLPLLGRNTVDRQHNPIDLPRHHLLQRRVHHVLRDPLCVISVWSQQGHLDLIFVCIPSPVILHPQVEGQHIAAGQIHCRQVSRQAFHIHPAAHITGFGPAGVQLPIQMGGVIIPIVLQSGMHNRPLTAVQLGKTHQFFPRLRVRLCQNQIAQQHDRKTHHGKQKRSGTDSITFAHKVILHLLL